MPSDTRRINFAVILCTFPGKTPSLQIEIPTAKRFDSLETASEWVKGFGNPMEVRAFVSVEILTEFLADYSRLLMERYDQESLDQLTLATKGSIFRLIWNLCDLETPIGDQRETRELEFQIYDIPSGITSVTPGTYVEISQGRGITKNVAWWRDHDSRFPGTVFGHISIEFPEESIHPDIATLIGQHHEGQPEGLEVSVRQYITDVFAHIIAGR